MKTTKLKPIIKKICKGCNIEFTYIKKGPIMTRTYCSSECSRKNNNFTCRFPCKNNNGERKAG